MAKRKSNVTHTPGIDSLATWNMIQDTKDYGNVYSYNPYALTFATMADRGVYARKVVQREKGKIESSMRAHNPMGLQHTFETRVYPSDPKLLIKALYRDLMKSQKPAANKTYLTIGCAVPHILPTRPTTRTDSSRTAENPRPRHSWIAERETGTICPAPFGNHIVVLDIDKLEWDSTKTFRQHCEAYIENSPLALTTCMWLATTSCGLDKGSGPKFAARLFVLFEEPQDYSSVLQYVQDAPRDQGLDHLGLTISQPALLHPPKWVGVSDPLDSRLEVFTVRGGRLSPTPAGWATPREGWLAREKAHRDVSRRSAQYGPQGVKGDAIRKALVDMGAMDDGVNTENLDTLTKHYITMADPKTPGSSRTGALTSITGSCAAHGTPPAILAAYPPFRAAVHAARRLAGSTKSAAETDAQIDRILCGSWGTSLRVEMQIKDAQDAAKLIQLLPAGPLEYQMPVSHPLHCLHDVIPEQTISVVGQATRKLPHWSSYDWSSKGSYATQAPEGSGKSHQAYAFAGDFFEEEYGPYAIVHKIDARVSNVDQAEKQYDFTRYDKRGAMLLQENTVMTTNSLAKLAKDKTQIASQDVVLLVIDEAVAVLNSFRESTMLGYARDAWTGFCYLVKRADVVLWFDAGFTQPVRDIIQDLRPETSWRRFEGDLPHDEIHYTPHRSVIDATVESVMQRMEDGETKLPSTITCGSKTDPKGYAQQAEDRGLSRLLITGDGSQVEDINTPGYNVVCASPAGHRGLSIDIPHEFSIHVGGFHAENTPEKPESAKQAIYRTRDLKHGPMTWIQESVIATPSKEQIKKWHKQKAQEFLDQEKRRGRQTAYEPNTYLDPRTGKLVDLNESFLDFLVALEYEDNLARNMSGINFLGNMQELGMKIILMPHPTDDSARKRHVETKRGVKEERARLINDAKDLTTTQYAALLESYKPETASITIDEEAAQLEKYSLLATFGFCNVDVAARNMSHALRDGTQREVERFAFLVDPKHEVVGHTDGLAVLGGQYGRVQGTLKRAAALKYIAGLLGFDETAIAKAITRDEMAEDYTDFPADHTWSDFHEKARRYEGLYEKLEPALRPAGIRILSPMDHQKETNTREREYQEAIKNLKKGDKKPRRPQISNWFAKLLKAWADAAGYKLRNNRDGSRTLTQAAMWDKTQLITRRLRKALSRSVPSVNDITGCRDEFVPSESMPVDFGEDLALDEFAGYIAQKTSFLVNVRVEAFGDAYQLPADKLEYNAHEISKLGHVLLVEMEEGWAPASDIITQLEDQLAEGAR